MMRWFRVIAVGTLSVLFLASYCPRIFWGGPSVTIEKTATNSTTALGNTASAPVSWSVPSPTSGPTSRPTSPPTERPTTTTTSPSNTSSAPVSQPVPLPPTLDDVPEEVLCLNSPFFGRTNNIILTIAKMLVYRRNKEETEMSSASIFSIGMDAEFSKFFLDHFDQSPHDQFIKFNYKGTCREIFSARDVFYMAVKGGPLWQQVQQLVPKRKHRQRALEIQQTWSAGRDFVSVHRRNLEGTCLNRAKQNYSDQCTMQSKTWMCQYTYDTIMQNYSKIYNNTNNNTTVVLFTDGQVAALDNTFSHRFDKIIRTREHFMVEMFLMTLSKVHYGVVFSSVDRVVFARRNVTAMEPTACFVNPTLPPPTPQSSN